MTDRVPESRAVDTLDRLGALIDRLERLEARLNPLLDQLEQIQPLAGMLGDMFDEYASKARGKGIAWDESGRNLLDATMRMGQVLGPAEMENVLKVVRMLASSPNLVSLLEKLAAAGLATQSANLSTTAPPTLGVFGLLRVLKEPSIQRTVNRLLAAARQFNGGT